MHIAEYIFANLLIAVLHRFVIFLARGAWALGVRNAHAFSNAQGWHRVLARMPLTRIRARSGAARKDPIGVVVTCVTCVAPPILEGFPNKPIGLVLDRVSVHDGAGGVRSTARR